MGFNSGFKGLISFFAFYQTVQHIKFALDTAILHSLLTGT